MSIPLKRHLTAEADNRISPSSAISAAALLPRERKLMQQRAQRRINPSIRAQQQFSPNVFLRQFRSAKAPNVQETDQLEGWAKCVDRPDF
jgi:hypothetical protein